MLRRAESRPFAHLNLPEGEENFCNGQLKTHHSTRIHPMAYTFPQTTKAPKIGKKQVLLIANGDLRQLANQKCWAGQSEMEAALTASVHNAGYELVRAHPFKESHGHGFIPSEKEGMSL